MLKKVASILKKKVAKKAKKLDPKGPVNILSDKDFSRLAKGAKEVAKKVSKKKPLRG